MLNAGRVYLMGCLIAALLPFWPRSAALSPGTEVFPGWLEIEVDAHDVLPGVGTVQIELAGRPVEGSTETWAFPDGEALLEVTVRDTSWSRNGTHIERMVQIDNRQVGPMPPPQPSP